MYFCSLGLVMEKVERLSGGLKLEARLTPLLDFGYDGL